MRILLPLQMGFRQDGEVGREEINKEGLAQAEASQGSGTGG